MTPIQLDRLTMAAIGAGYKVLHRLDYGLVVQAADNSVSDIWNPYRNVSQLYSLAKACDMVLDFGAKQARLGVKTASWGWGDQTEVEAILQIAISKSESAVATPNYRATLLSVIREATGYSVMVDGKPMRVSGSASIIIVNDVKYIVCQGPLDTQNLAIGLKHFVDCKVEV